MFHQYKLRELYRIIYMELYYKYLITLIKRYNYKKILNIINIINMFILYFSGQEVKCPRVYLIILHPIWYLKMRKRLAEIGFIK